CPTSVPTTAPPQLPHSFYGAVTLMGEPAPNGTTITGVAEDGGGSLITDTEGFYGDEGAQDDKLLVYGSIENGAPISFYVNGYRAECYDVEDEGPWQWTYPFTSGEVTELDLRVAETPPEPPVAIFSANTTSGNVPLVVGFTDDSLNTPTSWFWEFGDNETSTEQDPVHTYTGEGTYTVNLTVSNDAGDDTLSLSDYITVIVPEPLPPVAEFTANRTSGPAPLAVGFTDDSLNSPTSWFWEFGDGATSTEQNPVHTYTGIGNFTVNLTAANDYGDDSVSKQDYITVTTAAEMYYINATAGIGGMINPSGLVEVLPGANATFNITPLSYYTVRTITVDDAIVTAFYTYTFENVYQNHTIAATFRATSSGGGGGGGGGGGPVVTTIPTTVPTTPLDLTGGVSDSDTDGGVVTTIPTTEIPTETPVETAVTTPVPTTTVPPAQPFWSQFPLAWLIPIILVIIILAALAYYYYQKEKGEELFEEE
ncbi:MAG: PKD domain-containing protein, partial [Methanomicrobiales archaeon]|nr:PKD domain-containing protein [Methanomicrobiales archaeon]